MSGSTETFPYKLYNMLEAVSDCNYESIINYKEKPVEWLPDGNGFLIMNEKAFFEDIIPLYFSLTKMRSFTRQLNLWGFERTSTGSKDLAWQHPHFQRNDASRLTLIKRTAVKGSMSNRTKVAKVDQNGHIQGEENAAPSQSIPCTSMASIADFRCTGSSNLRIHDTAKFCPGFVDVSPYMPQTSALDYSVISSEEHTDQSNQYQDTRNKSYPRYAHYNGLIFDSPILQDDVPYQVPLLVTSKCSNNGFTFDSPILQDDAPYQVPSLVTSKCSNNDHNSPKETALGQDDDCYVIGERQKYSSCLSDDDVDHELESLFPKVKNEKQENKIVNSTKQEKRVADVSDIDFDAFISKYFPSS